jgi:hypothetical protein
MRCLKGGSRLHGVIAGDAATAVEASAAHGCVQGLFDVNSRAGKIRATQVHTSYGVGVEQMVRARWAAICAAVLCRG